MILRYLEEKGIPDWVAGFAVVLLAGGLFFLWAIDDVGPTPPAGSPGGPPVEVSTAAISLPEGEASGKDLAPEFALNEVNSGKELRLSSLRGKVVVLDFWATWCGPCRSVIPSLAALQTQYGDKVQIVGVSVDDPNVDLASFCRSNGISYAVVNDGDHNVSRLYGGINGIPTVVLIGRDGKLLASYVGAHPKEHYENMIQSALAKS